MKLRIGAHAFRVQYVRNLRGVDGDALWGLCDTDTQTVSLCATLVANPTKRVATILHEAIHAVEEQSGIKLEEREVKVLGESLAAFLLSNRWLRRRVTR